MKDRRHRRSGPPQDEQWIWLTGTMLQSPAWRALTPHARQIIDRVLIEDLSHAGTQNGALRITYDEFRRAGLPSRNAIAEGIRVAVALGFLDVPVRGRLSFGGARVASTYGLTWLDRCDGERASNRWKQVRDRAQAEAVVANAVAPIPRVRRPKPIAAMAATA